MKLMACIKDENTYSSLAQVGAYVRVVTSETIQPYFVLEGGHQRY